MEHPPKNKERANVVLDPNTYHDCYKMRTWIETGPYFYDAVDNNLICISLASLTAVWDKLGKLTPPSNLIRCKTSTNRDLNQPSVTIFFPNNYHPDEISTPNDSECSLQPSKWATSVERVSLQDLGSNINRKGEEGGDGNKPGGGGGRKRGPVYGHICQYLYPSQFLTTVSYVKQ